MKNVYAFLLLFLVSGMAVFAQMGISTNGSAPDNSAMLDVKSTNKGMLIPRIALTGTNDATTIVTPATSLLVYNTATVSDVTPGFYYWNGTASWVRLTTGGVASNPPITPGTNTKITYDAKGLVTAGAAATTADIAASTDKNYVTNAQLTVIGNTSGINTGDQTITLTGDVTGSGTGSFAATIAGSAVTNTKMANMAANTIKVNNTASAAAPADLSIAANTFPARNSSGNIAAKTVTDFALTILDDANAAAVRTTIGAGTGNGTVTGVTGTAPIVSSGGTAPVISISPATTSAAGSMSAADKTKLDGSTHAIGDNYGGGIVFYIYDGGQHGLIAATIDQSTSIQWYNGTYRMTGTTGDGVNAGAMNTAMIVATQMGDNQSGNFAAKVCADYSVTTDGVTYGDWYLPSKYELNLLYLQKSVVGGFTSNVYWSSSEQGVNLAGAQSFSGGAQNGYAKASTNYVRAVRAF